MKVISHAHEGPLREVLDLLETTRFSLETVSMALVVGKGPKSPQLTINNRLNNVRDSETQEAGKVATEALNTAFTAFLRLVQMFDSDELESLGYSIGFWGTFEWCWHRLFTEQARTTGHLVLTHELAEAMRRCRELERRLCGQLPNRFTT